MLPRHSSRARPFFEIAKKGGFPSCLSKNRYNFSFAAFVLNQQYASNYQQRRGVSSCPVFVSPLYWSF
jgi:hypothetical protein